MRQNTVNDEFDEVKWTGWRTYIPRVANVTNYYGDACSIVIFFVRFDLTYDHGVANFFSYVLGNIRKLDEAEGVCAFRALVLGAF